MSTCRHSVPRACISHNAAIWCKPDCKCWACVDCRAKLTIEWSNHVEELFSTMPCVFRLIVADDQWEATTTWLRRNFVGWAAVQPGNDTRVVYACTDPGRGAVMLTPEMAAADFHDRLSAAQRPDADKTWRPVTTSKGWGLNRAKNKDPDKPPIFSLGKMSRANFTAKLSSLGASVVEKCHNGWTFLKALLAVDVLAKLCSDFGKDAQFLLGLQGSRTRPSRTERAAPVPAWTG